MRSKMIKFWILAGATSLISNIVNTMPSPGGPFSPDDQNPSSVNALPASSRSIYDPNKAYVAACALETEIELTISAKKLRDPFGGNHFCLKPDPMCIISTHTTTSRRWNEYTRTEFIANNRHPEFAKKVLIPYSPFHETLSLQFAIYSHYFWNSSDLDKSNGEISLQDHNCLGYGSCELGNLLREGRLELKLKAVIIDTEKIVDVKGRVIVRAEKLINSYQQVVLRLTGVKLARKFSFGRPKRYIEIYKRSPNAPNEYMLAYRTEVVHRSLNPQWEAITIPLKQLCNGDYERSLKFMCWDWRGLMGNTARKFVGEFYTTLGEIAAQNTRNERTFTLRNRKTVLLQRKTFGQIKVDFELIEAPSLAEFIKAGLRIHCVVAVHFSDDPSKTDSLHYRDVNDSTSLSPFERTLVSLVDVLGDYDWDKELTLLGFGNHRNRDDDKPIHFANCGGIKDAVRAYRKHLAKYELLEGTDLTSVLQTVSTVVLIRNIPQNYFILFVLMSSETFANIDEIEKIVTHAALLPLSVILLGVGERPFSGLNDLVKEEVQDGNRNIVNFVSFRDCHHENKEDVNTRSCFANKLLAKLPSQVLSYMRSKEYTPANIILPEPYRPAEHVFPSRTYAAAFSSSSSNHEIVPFEPEKNVASTSQPSTSSSHSRLPLKSHQPADDTPSSSTSSHLQFASSRIVNQLSIDHPIRSPSPSSDDSSSYETAPTELNSFPFDDDGN